MLHSPKLYSPVALLVKNDARGGDAFRAARAYRVGDLVLQFEEVAWRPHRDEDTVQHPSGQHMFHPVLARTAHSCEPNCRVSFSDRALVALRAIEPGEAVTYDYETTESWFSHPFWCLCGSRRCRGRIG